MPAWRCLSAGDHKSSQQAIASWWQPSPSTGQNKHGNLKDHSFRWQTTKKLVTAAFPAKLTLVLSFWQLYPKSKIAVCCHWGPYETGFSRHRRAGRLSAAATNGSEKSNRTWLGMILGNFSMCFRNCSDWAARPGTLIQRTRPRRCWYRVWPRLKVIEIGLKMSYSSNLQFVTHWKIKSDSQ